MSSAERGGRRRPRRRGRRRPKRTWSGFWRGLGGVVQDSGPRYGSLFGSLFLLVAVVGLLGTGSSLQQNTELRAHGGRTDAVVVRVERVHHTGYRGGSWNEYWPVTRQTVDGETFEASLRRYAVHDDDTYRRGEHVTVLYDTHHHRTVALASDEARERLVGRVRGRIVLGGSMLVVLAVCLPIDIRRTVAKRRARRRPQPAGTARRRVR